MQTHNLIQGTPEWHQFRANHFGASEAAAMLGLSKHKSRTALLHEKATGITKEPDARTQAIFDEGHRVEAACRPLIEVDIGDDLSPVTLSDGKLSCSCDGLNFDGTIAWEHKQANIELLRSLSNLRLPEEYEPQCQQVLMITGAEKLIFTCSDGTRERLESIVVLPNPDWFSRLHNGWEQFEKDLAEYVPKEIAAKPVAEAIMALPALSIQIRGEVVTSNLPAFKAEAEQFIANINTKLVSDEDFVNAEAMVKYCGDTEKRIDAAKEAAIAQTADIADIMRTLDYIKGELRTKRLSLDNDIKAQKEAIRLAIITAAKLALSEYVKALEVEIEPIRLVFNQPDFAVAMKGLKKLDSIYNAVDTALSQAKAMLSELAGDMRLKLAWIKTAYVGYELLFHDLQSLIAKPMDDMQLAVTTRIESQKKAEAERVEEVERQTKHLEAELLRLEEEGKAKETVHQATAIGTPTVTEVPRAVAQAAVVDHQPEIAAFLKSRGFADHKANEYRGVIVEYIKFASTYGMKAAA